MVQRLDAVHVDESTNTWTCEMAPLSAIADGVHSRLLLWDTLAREFYRMDIQGKGFMAWNPTLQGSFHRPERFGWLEFDD